MVYSGIEIDIAKCTYSNGTVILPIGLGVAIPEEGATQEELELIQAIRADVENRIPIISDPIIATEPVDEEKAAMAEAIIDMSMEIELLKAKMEALEGGGAA